MKNLTLTFLSLLLVAGLRGQSIDRYVIASSGDEMSSGQYSIEWTLGEPVTATFQNSNLIINQGFHQGLSISTSIPESVDPEISIYPNPTQDRIHFDLPNNLSVVDISIRSIDGRLIRKGVSLTTESSLDMSDLASGTYIISIFNSEDQKVEKRVKVQKIK